MKLRELIIKSEHAIVPLTQGQFATIDLCDVDKVEKHNWYAQWYEDPQKYYAMSRINNNKPVGLHRFILNVTNPKIQVDHRDGNGLENRRFNIRVCTSNQNLQNQQSRKGNSIYKGVCFFKRSKKWVAYISYNSKRIHLGCYNDERIAAIAYNLEAKKLFGEFARLNKI